MKRSNIIALVLLLLLLPVFVMAYIPLVREVRKNVAQHAGQEILSRLQWFVKEYHRAPRTLHDAAVPDEDQGPEVHYFTFPEVDSSAFRLSVAFGSADSVTFDSKVGDWK